MAAGIIATSSWGPGRRAVCWRTGSRPTPRARLHCLEAGGPDRKREFHIPAAAIKLSRARTTGTTARASSRSCRTGSCTGRAARPSAVRPRSMAGLERGHRADYDGWAQSCPGWSYDEVLPYFQRAEHRVGSNAGGVYGTSGPQFISELRDPNPTTSASWRLRRTGHEPPRRTQRAGQHRIFTHPGNPAPGCGTAPRTPTCAPPGGGPISPSSPGHTPNGSCSTGLVPPAWSTAMRLA